MSEIAQAIANRQSEIDRLQAEIKALTDVEQILGASAPTARSRSRRSSSPPTTAAAAADSKSEAKPARKRRDRFGQLPPTLRYDIRAFFSTYKAACTEANRLLYSAGDQDAISRICTQAPVGKVLPDALYVHHSALSHLPPLLRVYEGCGRQLTGSIDGVTLVKLGRRQPMISYLAYPDFDRVGHPALTEAFITDLRRLTLEHRDYRQARNAPILHRKELFVSDGYRGRARFARLTRQEQNAGLYDCKDDIGHEKQWRLLLERGNLVIRGHRLVRAAARATKSSGVVAPSPSEPAAASENDPRRPSGTPSALRGAADGARSGGLS